MIKLTDWDRLYRHNIEWAISRMRPDSLKSYKDVQQDWVDALLAFDKVQEELFKDYGVTFKSGDKYKRTCIKGIELTAGQLFDLFHKHLNQYKNHTVRYFIFKWWIDLRPYIQGAQPILDCPWLYYSKATTEEIEQARKDFSKVKHTNWSDKKVSYSYHTFKDNAHVLEYRDRRFIVDNEWGNAWVKDKNGKVRSFQLEWDWWFPIDEYLDLENI